MTELEQFKKWEKDTKRYLRLIRGVEEIKKELNTKRP